MKKLIYSFFILSLSLLGLNTFAAPPNTIKASLDTTEINQYWRCDNLGGPRVLIGVLEPGAKVQKISLHLSHNLADSSYDGAAIVFEYTLENDTSHLDTFSHSEGGRPAVFNADIENGQTTYLTHTESEVVSGEIWLQGLNTQCPNPPIDSGRVSATIGLN